MKTFAEFQEALIAKNRNRRGGKLDPKVIRDNPNLDPLNPRDYMKLKRIQNSIEPDLAMRAEEVVAPTNNVGDGKIAGTVEAGDDPPVKKKKKKDKKKRYIYGGRGSRKTVSYTHLTLPTILLV